MTLLSVLAGLVLLQSVYSLIDGIRSARWYRSVRWPDPAVWPPVLVICPCRGLDAGFDDNIRSILRQDYPSYSVQFVVDSASDPAYQRLAALGVSGVLVAGPAVDCGQKVHNLMAAVQRHGSRGEVLVFCDADGRFPGTWLRDLVRPLSDTRIGATTGYRWYVPEEGNLPSWLRSAWNATVLSVLGRGTFAWGGSMGIRRSTFDEIRVLDHWSHALSDDFALTRACNRAKRPIVFVPACLVLSAGVCSWHDLFEFTNRQMIITRVYRPGLWKIALLSQTLFNVTFISLLGVIVSNGRLAIPWLAIYVLAAAKGWVRHAAVSNLHSGAGKGSWFFTLAPPLIALLQQWNLIVSGFSTNIVWRGIRYRLTSESETRIESPPAI